MQEFITKTILILAAMLAIILIYNRLGKGISDKPKRGRPGKGYNGSGCDFCSGCEGCPAIEDCSSTSLQKKEPPEERPEE